MYHHFEHSDLIMIVTKGTYPPQWHTWSNSSMPQFNFDPAEVNKANIFLKLPHKNYNTFDPAEVNKANIVLKLPHKNYNTTVG